MIEATQQARKIGIMEILARVGEDKLKVQPLNNSIESITLDKRGDSHVKFVTDGIAPGDLLRPKSRNVGVIIWVDTLLWEKAWDEARNPKGATSEPRH